MRGQEAWEWFRIYGEVVEMKKVVKRDGRIVEFDPVRIRLAVGRAQKAVGDKDPAGTLQSLVAIDATCDMA